MFHVEGIENQTDVRMIRLGSGRRRSMKEIKHSASASAVSVSLSGQTRTEYITGSHQIKTNQIGLEFSERSINNRSTANNHITTKSIDDDDNEEVTVSEPLGPAATVKASR